MAKESKQLEQLGTVVSTMDGPSPTTIDFVAEKEGMVHKGMFVELDYSEGKVISLVTDVIKTNRYFERPDSVKEIGDDLEKHFPTADWEFLIGKAKPLGVFRDNKFERTTFPPSPGTKVYKAENEHLKTFLGLEENGLMLGSMQFHDVPVALNMSKLLQKHLAILAMSGAGKSYGVSVLLEELLTRKKEQGQIGIVVIDTHGEYTCFGEPATDSKYQDFSSKTRIVDASKMRIAASKLNGGFLSMILPSLSSQQRRDLSQIISKLSQEMKSGVGPFDLNAVKSEVMGSDSMNDKTASTLLGILSELEDLHLFSKIDDPSLLDLVEPGKMVVIDFSGIISNHRKQVLTAYIANKLFTARRMKKVPPFALFVEEAHNYIPEKAGKDVAVAKGILRTIAREGRKFGAALVVISQRPKHLDTTTLANCNTHLILRITNPYDLDHIKAGSEGLDSNSISIIPSLRVGEGMLVGEAVSAPTLVRIRQRKSQPSKHETTLEESAKRYSADSQKEDEEAESFL